MDDPRKLLLHRVRQNKNGFIIDYKERWNTHILSSIIDSIFYTLADYIKWERNKSDIGMGKLEVEYYYTDDFKNSTDARRYLEENRDPDDTNLMLFVFDNISLMEPGTHRRTLLYLMNILYFDL
jgi:hypothetical protein